MASLEIKEQVKSPWTILHLSGKFDALTAPQVDEALIKAFQDGNHHVILELSGLNYLSSAGLRILLSHTKKYRASHREVVIVAVPEPVLEIIQLAGFEKVFRIESSIQDVTQH